MSYRSIRWIGLGVACFVLGCSPATSQENPSTQESTSSDASAQESTNTVESTPGESTGSVTEGAPPEGGTSQEDKALSAIQAFIDSQNIDKSNPGWRTSLPKPTQATFDANRKYYWSLQTNKGTLKIEFFPSVAPMHVTSTIYLTLLGFYDTLTFHRVITRFMAQGGDPLGNGRGGPGYKYAGEFSSSVKHDKPGILSMANAGPNTDGSQFFITFVATPHLNGKHTVFGQVTEGMDTLKALEAAGSRTGRPTEKLVIEKATIVVKGT